MIDRHPREDLTQGNSESLRERAEGAEIQSAAGSVLSACSCRFSDATLVPQS